MTFFVPLRAPQMEQSDIRPYVHGGGATRPLLSENLQKKRRKNKKRMDIVI